MQYGRVHIANPERVLYRLEPEVIRRAHQRAAFDAAAGEPDRHGLGVVIAPGALAILRWTIRRAPEFAHPHQQRAVKEAALLQILDERRNWLIGLLGVL